MLDPIDHNGDGHPDFIWHDTEADRIKAYPWNPNTNAFDTATVRTVRTTDGSKKRAHLFFDMNGDGHADYLYLTKLGSKGKLYTYLANDTGRTPDQGILITNGLGATTAITYGTLSRTNHYERVDLGVVPATNQFCVSFPGLTGCLSYTLASAAQPSQSGGNPTENDDNVEAFYETLNGGWNLPSGAQTLGKSGPILEFTGPVPVVTRVDGSAPKASAAPAAVVRTATSAVEYFYAEAKVRAMGRGLLGFQQIKTRDLQTGVETTTTYRQDFPFTGMPLRTEVKSDAGRLLSESTTTWKLKGYASTWENTAKTSGTASLGAFRPYAAKVVEKTYDLVGGDDMAPTLNATVTTEPRITVPTRSAPATASAG